MSHVPVRLRYWGGVHFPPTADLQHSLLHFITPPFNLQSGAKGERIHNALPYVVLPLVGYSAARRQTSLILIHSSEASSFSTLTILRAESRDPYATDLV